MWFEFAALSAVAKAGNQAVTKMLVQTEGVLQVAAIGQIVSGVLFLPLLLIPDLLQFPTSEEFCRAAWITIVLNVVVILCLVQAIRSSDLSVALPFLALSPALTVVSAWLMRGEVISVGGVVGIGLVVAGALTVEATSVRDGFRFGGMRVFKDRGVQLVTAVSCIWSYSAVVDKNATWLSSPLDFTVYSTLGRTAIFCLILLMVVARKRPRDADPVPSRRFVLRRRILVLYLLLGLTYNVESLFHVFALNTGLVALVVSVKRLSILVTSVVGMLFFREPFTLARLLGAVLMVTGSGVIYLVNG